MISKSVLKAAVAGGLAFFFVCVCMTYAFAGKNEELIHINFRNEDILAVLEFYSELLQKTFIPSEEIQGEVTVISPHPVSQKEAKELLFSILDMKQMAVVEYDSYFKVMTKQNATKSPLQLSGRGMDADRMTTGIINLKYAKAEDIAPDLARLISDDGAIFAAKELNYVVVTSTAANFRKIEAIVRQIDQPDSVPEARAYKIQYMKAEEFAATLTKVAESSLTKDGVWGGVIAVKETNSVIVTATAAQHEAICRLIKQLDVSQKQVSISAMFVEVTLKDELSMGVEWFLQGLNHGVHTNIANESGSWFNNAVGTVNAVQTISGTGLKLSILKTDQYSVLAKFLSSNGNTRVISTPHILAMENQEAKLRVGNQVPVKKGTRYDNDNHEISTYEQLDLGLELVVTPVVSNNREVTMNIQQKLSSLVSYNSDNGTYQSSEREASTTVSVMDQETLVIGGLISHRDSLTKSGIPGFKDIPLLGYFFGNEQDDNNMTELLIFITPTVISNSYEADQLNIQEKSKSPTLIDETHMEFDL